MPMGDRRDFLCEGHYWRSSSIEMAVGDCAKSSTILYEWATFPEAVFQHNRPLGILV